MIWNKENFMSIGLISFPIWVDKSRWIVSIKHSSIAIYLLRNQIPKFLYWKDSTIEGLYFKQFEYFAGKWKIVEY